MKSLLLLCVVYQLTEAINIPLVAINTNSWSSRENLHIEGEIQSLRISARAIVSGLLAECGEEPWRQLVAINMSSADSQCPDGWVEENEEGVRACGRGPVSSTCESVHLNNIHQIEYTRVCGKAIGYQYGNPDAFAQRDSGVTVDQNYVDGLTKYNVWLPSTTSLDICSKCERRRYTRRQHTQLSLFSPSRSLSSALCRE